MKPSLLTVTVALLSFGLGWLSSGGWEAPDRSQAGADAFDSALRDALGERSPLRRTQRLAELFDSMRAEQIAEAVAVYDRELSMLAGFEIELLFEAWARHDPLAALAHVETWSAAAKRQPAFEATIQGWALRDPLAAQQAVAELLDDKPALRRLLLKSLVVGWVHSGQPGVVEYLLELPEHLQGIGSVALVGAQTRRLGAGGLTPWADGVLRDVDDDEFDKEIFRRVAKSLARRDPEEAAAWVDTHAEAGYAEDRVRLVVEYGLPRDPEAMLAWAGAFDPGIHRPAIRAAALQWLKGDFAGAARFIEEAPLAPLHDPIVDEYARALVRRSEWATGIAWAQRIDDEKLRLPTLKRATVSWLRKDPTAAERWLEESPFDDTEREALRAAAARSPDRRQGDPLGDRIQRAPGPVGGPRARGEAPPP